MLRQVFGWIFFVTQIGILFTMASSLMLMKRINAKLDRDRDDRELLRTHLLRESDKARAAVEAIDPLTTLDRRKNP